MLPEFKAAMFDMDGTILHTMRYWRLTTVELLLSYDIIPTPEDMGRVFSSSSRKLCQEIFERNGIYKTEWEVLRELEGFMHGHYRREAKAKRNAARYLERLRARGIPMCVATAAPKEFAAEVLERLGMAQNFEFITDCYEMQARKDSAAFFDVIAGRLGVNTRQLCVFEDALYAMRGAKEAGCAVVAIRDAIQKADWPEIRKIADFWAEDYDALLMAD